MSRFETGECGAADETPAMKLPATQALFAYWTSQCRGRCAPDRHDIDPGEMRGVLPHTFMLEVDGTAAAYPIRISGTRLDALFGRTLKGASFADLWAPDGRAEMHTILSGVLDDAQPALVGLRGAPTGYAESSFELLVLPLRHHGRTHARLLCGLIPAQSPSWLGLRSIEHLALSSWRFVDRHAETVAEQSRDGGIRRDHLVVYQGGRGEAATSTLGSQSRVKTAVPRLRDTLLSTRRS